MSGKRSRANRKCQAEGGPENCTDPRCPEKNKHLPRQEQDGLLTLSPKFLEDYGPEKTAEAQQLLDLIQSPREGNSIFKLPSMVISDRDNSFMMVRDPGIKRRKTSLGLGNGETAEDEVREILLAAGLPRSIVFKDSKYDPGDGERQVGDSLMLYGETAFMIQIKSRNKEAGDVKKDAKWGQRQKTEGYRQSKTSLEWLEEEGSLPFEAMDKSIKSIRRDQYNWVALIVLNYNETPFTMDSNLLRVSNEDASLPRVVITTHDLETIARMSRNPLMFVSYLRKLQFQNEHRVGEEWNRLYEFMDLGIYPFEGEDRPFAVLDFEAAITASGEKGTISLKEALQLRKGLDHAPLEELAQWQAGYLNGLQEVGQGIRKDHKIMNGVCYSTVYLNNAKHKLAQDQLEQVALRTTIGSLQRYSEEEVDMSICLVVDRDRPQDLSFRYSASGMLHREGLPFWRDQAERQGVAWKDLGLS